MRDGTDESALTKALGEFEDIEDRRAAVEAAKEEVELVGADEVDFKDTKAGVVEGTGKDVQSVEPEVTAMEAEEGEKPYEVMEVGDDGSTPLTVDVDVNEGAKAIGDEKGEDEDEEGGTLDDYMISFVWHDVDYFNSWNV